MERPPLDELLRVRCTLPPFWSEYLEEVQLGAVAGTVPLPSMTIADIPDGATVIRALVNFKCRVIENTDGGAANMLDGATVALTSQVIQVQNSVAGTWTDAINFVDNLFAIALSTREGGDLFGGQIDVSGEVNGNGTYDFRWLLGKVDVDFLNFNDVQVALEICYSL